MPAIVGNETRPQAPGRGPAQQGGDPIAMLLAAAESALGVQYRWGGNSLATGVDCSGLVQQAFRAAGISLPRVSNQQAQAGQAVDFNNAQPGDLLWYDNSSRNNGADHIAIYMGNGMMIEAPSRGKPVRVVAARKPTGVTRVVGVVPPSEGVKPPTLGPNGSRNHTTAAVQGTPPPAPTETVSGAVQTDGGLGDDLPPNATPEQTEAYIKEHFPSVAPFLANAEMRKILFSAAQEDWSDAKLDQELRGTDYFRTHGPDSRRFDLLLGTDEKAAKELGNKTINTITGILQRNGIEATKSQIEKMASKAIREGWISFDSGQVADPAKTGDFTAFLLRLGQDPGEMRDGVFTDKETGRKAFYGPNKEAGSASRAEIEKHAAAGDVIKSHKMPDGRTAWYIEGKNIDESRNALPAGEASFDADGVQAIARQYLVPITRRDAEDWALRMMEGNASEESLKSWLGNLAKARYAAQPDILAAIEAGSTPSQYFAGHRATVADILELGDDQIDLMDPKFSWAMEMVDDKGNRRAPTLGEVANLARQRPEFAKTRSYKSKTSEFALGLSEFMGKVA